MNNKEEFFLKKDKSYFSNIRFDIIEHIKCKNCKVLEIGCGDGNTLVELKRTNKANFIVGVDVVNLDQNKKLDKFILADFEKDELELTQNYFDIIICADVLEHLIDPWKALGKLKKFLKTDGVLIASIPNFKNYYILKDIILKGDFKYVDEGILDRTHLRFFCKKNIIEMFEKSGYEIIQLDYNPKEFGKKVKLLNFLTFNKLKDFFIFQYIVIAKKIGD